MCLILLALDSHPRWRLVVGANRDEFFARPTAPAAFWDDAPYILAGRDLREGGTWLGITRSGRFAAVTNVREPPERYRTGAISRGFLVSNFLKSRASPENYTRGIAPYGDEYNGFNLLLGDREQLVYYTNRETDAWELDAGVYGLSNARLDTPWPKVARGKEDLRRALEGPEEELEGALFASLALRDPAPDARLPSTGIDPERERALSAAFIVTPEYGTRCSTVLLIGRDGEVRFTERTTVPGENRWTEVRHELRLDEG